jgi:hypothetical protein
MARPSELPEWASGGSAQVVDPTSGKKAIGWTSKEKPANQLLNWWQKNVYSWIDWLAAGVLDGNWEFTGNVKVDGNITSPTGIYGATTSDPVLAPKGVDAATGNIVAEAGYVDGTAIYFENSITIDIPASAGKVKQQTDQPGEEFDSTYGVQTAWNFHGNTYPVMFPIVLPVGAVITGYSARVRKTSNGSQTITMMIIATDETSGAAPPYGNPANADTANGSGATLSSNNPGYASVTPALVPTIAAVDNTHHYTAIVHTNGTFDAEDWVLGVKVSYKMPHP